MKREALDAAHATPVEALSSGAWLNMRISPAVKPVRALMAACLRMALAASAGQRGLTPTQ